KDRYNDPDSHDDARFQSPYAARVPRTVATAVVAIAMIKLFTDDSIRLLSSATARYHCKENPCHTAKREELKLNTARISKGTCRNAYAPKAYNASPFPFI